MKLKKGTECARQWFDADSVPTHPTIKKWIEEGHVPGTIIGTTPYVDESKWVTDITGNEIPDKNVQDTDGAKLLL